MKHFIFALIFSVVMIGCSEYPGLEECIFTPNQEFDKNPKCFATAITLAQEWQEMRDHINADAHNRTAIINPIGERVLLQHGFIPNPTPHPNFITQQQRKVVFIRATQKHYGWYIELFYAKALGHKGIVICDQNWNELSQIGAIPMISGFQEGSQSGKFRSYFFQLNSLRNYLYLIVPGHTNLILTRG